MIEVSIGEDVDPELNQEVDHNPEVTLQAEQDRALSTVIRRQSGNLRMVQRMLDSFLDGSEQEAAVQDDLGSILPSAASNPAQVL